MFMGAAKFGGMWSQKNYRAIKIKSGANDYVGEGNPHAQAVQYGNGNIVYMCMTNHVLKGFLLDFTF